MIVHRICVLAPRWLSKEKFSPNVLWKREGERESLWERVNHIHVEEQLSKDKRMEEWESTNWHSLYKASKEVDNFKWWYEKKGPNYHIEVHYSMVWGVYPIYVYDPLLPIWLSLMVREGSKAFAFFLQLSTTHFRIPSHYRWLLAPIKKHGVMPLNLYQFASNRKPPPPKHL